MYPNMLMLPILPDELKMMVFQYTPSSLFLINKQYTRLYLRPKYKHIYFQKRCAIPLFKYTTRRTVFNYAEWVHRFGLFLDPTKFSSFDFEMLTSLTNCEVVDVYLQGKYEDDYFAITLDCRNFNEIISLLRNLNKQFFKYDQLLLSFQLDFLTGLHIVSLNADVAINLASLQSLTLFYLDELDIADMVFPHIKELKVYEYESSNIDLLAIAFANLESLYLGMNETLKCNVLPSHLKCAEIVFIHNFQTTLPLPFVLIDSVTIKVPFPHIYNDLYESGLSIKQFSFYIGNQLCLTNYSMDKKDYRLFKYLKYNVYIRNMKITCNTAMIQQLGILIGIQDTLWLSQSFVNWV